MKLPVFFQQFSAEHAAFQKERRAVIARSNEALSLAKRAIFALHRGEKKEVDAFLRASKGNLEASRKLFRRFPDLGHEGSYRAALEEYGEAVLFADYVHGRAWKKPTGDEAVASVFLGALSDATGEMVRFATRAATQGKNEEVARAQETVEAVVEYLLGFDLTGQLRQKFDQAKRNLKQLEEMRYELVVRGKEK
jgi:predicted translin family RNA/ssDNA-binding protein